MTMKNESIISLFSEYLLREHRSDICKLSLLLPSEPHQSIIVHFNNLCEFNSIFSELILSKPEETLNLLNKSVYQVIQSNKVDSPKQLLDNIQQNIHIRLTALPIIPEVYKNHIPTSIDTGKFIALRAIVSRVGPVQVIRSKVQYYCTKCGYTFSVYADFENFYALKPPRYCPNRQKSCNSMNLKCVSSNSQFYAKNYQEIRVHEQFDCLTVGVMRRSMCVCIEDDLLECVKPGDEVVINGVVTRRWRCTKEGSPCEIFTYLKANYIENLTELKAGGGPSHISHERALEFEVFWNKYTNFSSALEGRNILLRSICPEVYGMYLIKLSLALMLASAPEWHSTSGVDELSTHIRGNPHILLIGDPGTAKSVLLRGCTSLCDRAVLTTATGTTAAGLTATAIRDSTGWTLDAGALVLADGGLCAIDEFTALHGVHRAAVHEAMEQQTISLAKAGLMARLNCRCSVLAAANPSPNSILHGNEDFGLPTPLLSRFDLIWRLVDPVDSLEWDRRIANFVLDLDQPTSSSMKQEITKQHHLWSKTDLKEYFVWIRDRFTPQLSLEAANLLQRYYVWQRSQMSNFCNDSLAGAFSRRTLRLLESLVRLTKAHARLMCRNEATIEDAIVVIYLVDCSLYSTSSIKPNQSHLNDGSLSKFISPELIVSMNIPENPSVDYLQIEKLVMSTLNNNNTANIDDDNGYLNRFKQDPSNTYKKVQLEPLLSSTQLITNNNRNNDDSRLKKYTQENSGQRYSLTSYKRTFHHDDDGNNNKCSPVSVTQNNDDVDDLFMIPTTKSFKWTALNHSVDIHNNITTINTTDNQILNTNIDINMNKPLWIVRRNIDSIEIDVTKMICNPLE
ncbi:putative DNA replication licensing factor MCM1 [Schistosoma mansoni]|uniref:putative DNA replication licensing factor MCM1 n=1 Tax=Schistosoma mansoni TaxID=6183 RepID=UPI0001A640C9|nr:putative DNA replication licensing factor MCM1 [Schistosoma mansoni]|eukprot:XP_018649502.1 putative DNA replication licensing factor MCM1 [Schistosoma mansoni]